MTIDFRKDNDSPILPDYPPNVKMFVMAEWPDATVSALWCYNTMGDMFFCIDAVGDPYIVFRVWVDVLDNCEYMDTGLHAPTFKQWVRKPMPEVD